MAKKINSALTAIIKEAKRLKREYPRRYKKWTQYVSQASAIYSSTHKGKSPVGHKRKPVKKKSMPAKKHSRKRSPHHHTRKAGHRRVGAGSGISTNSRRHTDYNRNKVYVTVGAVNKHKKAAKEKLLTLIGREEVKKFTAKLKRVKKKVAKKISKYKSDYRRLSI
jgi:hypothetical protein